MAHTFVVGFPFGFTDNSSTNWPPGTSLPDYQIWEPFDVGFAPYYIPRRTEYQVATVPATRTLSNGVKIDKFRGYAAPKTYPREVWNWVERRGRGHTLAQYYGGGSDFSNRIVGELINIYVVKLTPSGNGEVWAARARCESFRATNDPQFGADDVPYTAEFERMTDYTYVTLLSIAPP